MDALAGKVRRQRRGQVDESRSDFHGHTGPVHGAHAHADVLHAFGGNVGCGGLEGSPAVMVVSMLRERETKRIEGSLHDTGCDGVDADTPGCLLLCESAGESHDGALGGGVVDLRRVAHVAEDGSAVDDVVAALHVLESVLAERHHLDDVGLEGLGDGGDVDFAVVFARHLHGSVVDKHVDLAEDLNVLVDGGLAAAFLGQVVLQAVALAASVLDLRDGVLRVLLLLGEVEDRDISTLSCHEDSSRATNAAVATGDKDGLVLQKSSAFILFEVGLAVVTPVLELCPVGLLLHVLVETRTALLVLGRDLPCVGGGGAFVSRHVDDLLIVRVSRVGID